MLRRNNDEFRIPLFLEERPLPRVPKYSKEVFREVYEPTPSDVEKGKSRLQKWMSALKKRLAGKKSDQLIQDKNFINGQTEPCSQCSLRERPGRSRGMIVERQRPVSMYDFRVTHQEKVLTLTPHSNTGTTYATVVAAPYTHSPTHVDRPHQPQQHLPLPGLIGRRQRDPAGRPGAITPERRSSPRGGRT
ncbi:uncharacterized protein LOC129595635 [Paramacrobiotus metropolitanus]|uniref:uncharacterized protein LOC129595635 n=1 Tax=Paramacrobiotus metropolitanus TaxID=2943436 RepID=UPI002445D4D2|nr:uncharacterized protein LOC129595635 [Paramacrobiotus metropolitanus]